MSRSIMRSHWHHPVLSFKTSTQDFYTAIREALAPHNLPGAKYSTVDWKEGGVLSARRQYFRIEREKLRFDVCAAPYGEDFFFSWWLTEEHGHWGFLRLIAILIGLSILYSIIAGILGAMMVFGHMGFLGAILGAPLSIIATCVAIWAIGSAIHNGTFGPDAEDTILDTPIIGWLYDKLFGPNTYYKIDMMLTFQAVIHSVVTDVVNARLADKGMRPLNDLEAKPVMHGLLAKSQHAGK